MERYVEGNSWNNRTAHNLIRPVSMQVNRKLHKDVVDVSLVPEGWLHTVCAFVSTCVANVVRPICYCTQG